MSRLEVCALIMGMLCTGPACGANDGASRAAAGDGGTVTTGTGAGGTGPGTGGSSSTGAGTAGAMPAGDCIAAKYPGDVGIENDPNVILADDFEDDTQASDLSQKWDGSHSEPRTRIATEPENVFHGQKAVEFTLPQSDTEVTAGLSKILTEKRDVLYLRYYSKFHGPFDVRGSSHNGGVIKGFLDDVPFMPGVPADGTNHFSAVLDANRGPDEDVPSPGRLHIYSYNPDQRSQWGDHYYPTGQVIPFSSEPKDFGPNFVSRPDIIPELDRWYCYELMLKANTPGQRDGRITVWLDGAVVMDFENLRFRDIDSLKINLFLIGFHILKNINGEQKKDYDNVVAATSCIGPMVQ